MFFLTPLCLLSWYLVSQPVTLFKSSRPLVFENIDYEAEKSSFFDELLEFNWIYFIARDLLLFMTSYLGYLLSVWN